MPQLASLSRRQSPGRQAARARRRQQRLATTDQRQNDRKFERVRGRAWLDSVYRRFFGIDDFRPVFRGVETIKGESYGVIRPRV